MTKGIRPLAAAVAVAAAAGMAGSAQAANGVDTTALQNAVKVGNGRSGIRSHLRQLQLIADRPGNNGNRATATQGHGDSVGLRREAARHDRRLLEGLPSSRSRPTIFEERRRRR